MIKGESNLQLDKTIHVLTILGLTPSQARIYLTLAHRGSCTAKSISKISKVPREHVYRVMPQLQHLGLVDKILKSPSEFKALPIQKGLSMLIKRRAIETQELQEQTKKIIESWKNNYFEIASTERDFHFILISRKQAAISKRKKEIEAAQASIDTIVSLQRIRSSAHAFQEVVAKVLEKGVKFRVITERPGNINDIPEIIIQNLKKYTSMELKYILKPPSAIVTIFDKKRLLMSTSSEEDLGNSDHLWSNNPSLLSIFNGFYEIMWVTAIENLNSIGKVLC